MAKKSAASKVVRKAAKDIPRPSKADLDRLRNAAKNEVDTSEIPEGQGFDRLKRDANGVLPRPKSPIREAVERQRVRLGLSVYRLWRKARVFHPTLSQAAVHEFLKGQRQLELPSAEALLAAADLQVVQRIAVKRLKLQSATQMREKKRVR